ncbi:MULTISPECIES: hypothetical protein [Hymenobacter]|uniref:Uncharacterized protein n=1 Tax=Hymenobacter jejuensis TaxID=2502781 RepID=A0A5B7ZZT3_9BACT|nr:MULTISPECIES: hypothetical protein [Hymenobacter]MBC6991086.1 hypothetical protein [Hymenobacter sp. BT491]QDA60530.1 hypothetical protein FHG12_10600 [Hymenobacter jejuensis]
MEYEVGNLSLQEATRHAPVVDYARCIDVSKRPANHAGDWPEEGKLYPVRVVNSLLEGMPLIHILGFQAEAPYYNAYAPHRFQMLYTMWLN